MPAPDTDQSTEGLQPVDSNYQGASPEGVYNLAGNAYEMTSSYIYLSGVYDMAHWDGTSENFKGLERYAARGGSWVNYIEYISHYNEITGTTAREDLGFRCGTEIK
jgi:formylglycine-generating enzyme required for sulfatase activity